MNEWETTIAGTHEFPYCYKWAFADDGAASATSRKRLLQTHTFFHMCRLEHCVAVVCSVAVDAAAAATDCVLIACRTLLTPLSHSSTRFHTMNWHYKFIYMACSCIRSFIRHTNNNCIACIFYECRLRVNESWLYSKYYSLTILENVFEIKRRNLWYYTYDIIYLHTRSYL